jgi:PAS domain-containing protein
MKKTFLEIHNRILGSIREPLIVLDPDLKVVKANHTFYRTFNVNPDETEGVLIYDLGNGNGTSPGSGIAGRHPSSEYLFNDFEVEHTFETIGPKIMHLNARRIYGEGNQTDMILLAIEDVTEREYYKRHLEELVARNSEQGGG